MRDNTLGVNKTITTIIPTYKRPFLLKKAVESVLSQTHKNFIVCVYDNASNDETEDIVRDLMKQDSRIRYYRHLENIGMMANYQFAFSLIDTPYFSFLSDDDYILPHFFEIALQGFGQYPDAAFSACGVKAVDENGELISDPLSDWPKEGYFFALEGLTAMIGRPLLPNGILFQHALVEGVRLDPSKDIQIRWDTDYLLQIILRFPFVVNKRVEAFFLAHSRGYSTSYYRELHASPRNFFRILDAREKIKQRLLPHLETFPKHRRDVTAAFSHQFKTELNFLVYKYIDAKFFNKARAAVLLSRRRYGFSRFYLGMFLRIWIHEKAKWLVPIARRMYSLKRRLGEIFSKKLSLINS